MIDQATELRKLVLRAMREGQSLNGPPPRLVLLTSGHRGVGVTTLGVNLSVAFAEQGLRVVLVDANATQGGVARLCGLGDSIATADLLGTRRDIHEFIQPGPAGIQVVPGLRARSSEPELSSMALERLLRQFALLGRHADTILLDLGNGPNDILRRLAQAAEDVIVVTSPDSGSITDAYARIKLTLSGTSPAVLWLVVNLAETEEQAADVHQRLRQSCERFLGHGIQLLGFVPTDASVVDADGRHVPVILERADATASQAIQRIAIALASRGGSLNGQRTAA
jgi:flagellar biosynthesis protein FlhG